MNDKTKEIFSEIMSELGKKRWAKISKKERSRIMSERRKKALKEYSDAEKSEAMSNLAKKRWNKDKNDTLDKA